MIKTDKTIIFFDSECLMCHSFVRIILILDHKSKISFAPLGLIINDKSRQLDIEELGDSIILLAEGEMHSKSEAVYKISATLGFPANILLVFKLLPKKWTDKCYDWIARRRDVFRKGYCPLIPKKYQGRFIRYL